MPIINSISNIKKEMQEWRRYLHENPELGFEEYNTSKFIVKKLNELVSIFLILCYHLKLCSKMT